MDGDWDDGLRGLVEPVPVDDVFVTGMPKIEQIGDGSIVRCWFCAEEGAGRILRAKLVIPLACAAIMNLHGTRVLTDLMRSRPHGLNIVPTL